MSYSAVAYFNHEADQPWIINDASDVDRLVDAVVAESFDNSIAELTIRERPLTPEGYPDHQLRFAVNDDGTAGGICLIVDGKIWFGLGKASERERVFYCFQGNDIDFPRDSELPIEGIRETVKAILSSGGQLPDTISWAESLSIQEPDERPA